MVTNRNKKWKELEVKNNNITDPQSPKCQSTSSNDTDEAVLAPQPTNTLVPSEKELKEDNMENNSRDDSETDIYSDDTMDNIVLKSDIEHCLQ